MKNLCFSLVTILLAINSLEATIRRVPQQYQIIQEAITASDNADTVLVDKGTYPVQLFISRQITLIGLDEDSVIVTWDNGTPGMTGTVIHIDSCSNVTLERMTVVGKDSYVSYFQGAENAMEISFSQNIHLLSLHLSGGRGWDAYPGVPATNGGYGIAANSSQYISIDSCIVYGGEGGSGYSNVHGSQADASPGNSLVFANNSTGTVINSVLGHATQVDASSSLTITNTVVLTTGVASNDAQKLPATFRLMQNFPNPFNPSTLITYQLPVRSSVFLRVYDVLGREVETMAIGMQSTGVHSITLNANGLPSGVYFYTLEAPPYHETKKFILLK